MSQPSSLAAGLPTPRRIVEHLGRTVVGQDRAKRTLAVAVANHYVRLFDMHDRESSTPTITDACLRQITIEKSNVLLIGSSGSGKTHLARALARCLDVPFAVASAATLTEAEHVGEDVESVLHKLLLAADMDVQAAQRGIVYIDQIDRLGDGGRATKEMRIGFQFALLKLIEGTVVGVPPSSGCKTVEETAIPFDTSNVMFLCGGAFVGLEDVVARRLVQKTLAFEQRPTGVGDVGLPRLRHVLPEDLEGFGMIPELVDRLPVVVTLDVLSVEDLMRILREPKDSLVAQYQKLMNYHKASLEFTEGAIRAIAELSHNRRTGAHGLRAIVQWVLEPVLYNPHLWLTHRVTEESIRGGGVEVFGLFDDESEKPRPILPWNDRSA